MRDAYRCVGPVRGACGVRHRTLSGAVACVVRDRRWCRRVGGYSDRWIDASDGRGYHVVKTGSGEYHAEADGEEGET